MSVAAPSKAGTDVQWTKCPSCDAFVYYKRLQRNLGVCPECNYHFRIPVGARLDQLLDEGSFEELSGDLEPLDVLGFADSKPYAQRIQEAQKKTGTQEGVTYGTATAGGHPLVVSVMNFGFVGGSMGSAVGEGVTRAAELALERKQPLLVVCASGGARMQEGCVSLMQMAKTSQAFARLHEGGILVVCLLTDPTYGGVSASFATLGDVLLAEPNSYIGFAGPKVIEQTIRQQLPDGFQTAEFLMDHGMLDLVEPRENIQGVLRKLLELHTLERGDLPETEGAEPVTDPDSLPKSPAWDIVQLARNIERPNTLEYVGYVFDDFQELYGDRLFQEDAAIVGGVGRLGDVAVVVIGHQKGHTTSEMMELMMQNSYYSVISPEGCSTILFKDAAQAPRAAEVLRLTAADLLRLGIMDAVVPEPEGGAHTDPPAAAASVKTAIVSTLRELLDTPTEELLERRYDRFRKFGAPGRQPTLPPIEESP